MKGRSTPGRCTVAGCGAAAAYAFLAVTGQVAERITDLHGRRVRACKPHFQFVTDRLAGAMQALPGGGPARLRPVPLTV